MRQRVAHAPAIVGMLLGCCLVSACAAPEGDPDDIVVNRPGILVPHAGIAKEPAFSSPRLNLVQEIRARDLDGDGAPEILVLGAGGACALNRALEEQRCFKYEIDAFDAYAADLQGDGSTSFVAGALWGKPAVAILDAEGRRMWSYDAEFTGGRFDVLSAGPGAAAEIVLAVRDAGLRFFSATGEVLRTVQSGHVGYLEAADLEGDGSPEIVTADWESGIAVLSAEGEPRRSKRLDYNFTAFAVIDWFDTGSSRIVVALHEVIDVLDAELQAVIRLHAPMASRLHVASAATVRLRPEAGADPIEALITVLQGRSSQLGSLYVHSLDGELLYQEVLEDWHRGLLVTSSAGPGPAEFLLGSRDQVWRYSW